MKLFGCVNDFLVKRLKLFVLILIYCVYFVSLLGYFNGVGMW